MSSYKTKFNPFTKKLQWVVDTTSIEGLNFKDGVATYSSLPITGNAKNDARITNDTHHLYIWSLDESSGDLSDWIDQGDIIDISWDSIDGKPSSSVVDIDDAVSKKHTQNTDEYLNTQLTHKIYVDGNRTDIYISDGSITKPFKTIQSAIDSITTATIYNRFTVEILPGKYIEQIILKNYVNLLSIIPDSVWIESADGDVVTTSADANLYNIGLSYIGTDSSKVALKMNSGSILIAREINIYANYTGLEINNNAILICYNGGTLTGEADSVIIKNGGYAWFSGVTLSGFGAPYYDLTIESGGYADIMILQCYNERINNLGTLNLLTPSSRIKNDSTVTGNNVKDALDLLNSNKVNSEASGDWKKVTKIQYNPSTGEIKVEYEE